VKTNNGNVYDSVLLEISNIFGTTMFILRLFVTSAQCASSSVFEVTNDRTKHIEIKYHLVREQIQQENILVIKVRK